ncbi:MULTISPECIES: RHS repeat-associated core domain-containing protein, partial [unclassified Streptomyces]|uniref:RHS repeat-associated core domain-containing protein n=1 Tax=unclassified Streptomyces TaxID=2593676 RepID=UPI00081EEF7E
TGATAYRQSFTFDWLGNRATMTEHNTADATKNVGYVYGYGTTVTGNGLIEPINTQPHTLAWIGSTPSGQGSSYSYDATGNTEVRDLPATTQSLKWSPDNKLESITDDGDKTSYIYDAAGNRLLEHSPAGATLHLGETELTTDTTGKITRASRAYAHPGAPTVVRTTSNGATTGHKLHVLLADHLGTAGTSVELSGGQAVTRREFKPYGEARGPKPTNWPNKRGYLGVGIDDAATGLTHIGAREYDQNAGRFLSADPVTDLADPLQMNGYAYGNGSPVSKSDPSGLLLCMCAWLGNQVSDLGGGGGGSDGGDTGGGGATPVQRNEGKTNLGNCLSRQKTAHDAAVCATGFAAASWAKKFGNEGFVTVDVGRGGHAANDIPGAKADGSGADGRADVIFWSNGTVYIWEVKPTASKKPKPGDQAAAKKHKYAFEDGLDQLIRYVNKLEDHLDSNGDTRRVARGPALATAKFAYGKDRTGTVWSDKDAAYEGMRYYGVDPKRKRTPSPSPGPGPSPDASAASRPTARSTSGPTPSATGMANPPLPGQPWWSSEWGMILVGLAAPVVLAGGTSGGGGVAVGTSVTVGGMTLYELVA